MQPEVIDLTNLVTNVRVEIRIAATTKKPYAVVVVEYANDYPLEHFPDKSELALLKLLAKQNKSGK